MRHRQQQLLLLQNLHQHTCTSCSDCLISKAVGGFVLMGLLKRFAIGPQLHSLWRWPPLLLYHAVCAPSRLSTGVKRLRYGVGNSA